MHKANVSELWECNYDPDFNTWCVFLHDQYVQGGLGKDFDTIRFWIDRFESGENTEIAVTSSGYVPDGNHRLVAAKLAGLEEIGVIATDYYGDPL